MIVIVAGLPGSGKSFFASRLAKAIHATYVSSDRLRKEMIVQRTYSKEEKELVYDEMLKQVHHVVKQNNSLVLDATFFNGKTRNKFKEKIKGLDALAFIEIVADEAIIKERLQSPREALK